MLKAIVNGRIVVGRELLSGHAIVFSDRVEQICPTAALPAAEIDQIFDAGDLLVSPGLIDTHVHGIAGADLMDGSLDSLRVISRALARQGITAFLPTTMSRPLPEIEAALQIARQAIAGESLPGARLLGVHLEGPFLSPQYAGAQAQEHLLPPDHELISAYRDVIRLVTYAPELDAQGVFAAALGRMEVIASIGHTGADYETVTRAIEQGTRHATHLFNAMPQLQHRQPGPVGAILEHGISCELIADNLHLHPAVYRLVLQAIGLEQIILVSDCMRAAGMGDGIHELGGQAVQVQGGVARLPDGRLAGSVTTLNQAVRNFQAATELSWPLALRPATANPAALLGATAIGGLTPGNYADIACFDRNMHAQLTVLRGEVVYQRD